jgi:branched-chain amino acid transport system ATP-binding protein
MALFKADQLHKRFGDQVVLENISLSVEEGQLCGIMGPNGAGKTTCFNVLTGRYKPDRGEVHFDGKPIGGRSAREIAHMGISRSFQIMNLFDEYNAIDNIVIALPQVRRKAWSVLRDLARQQSAYDEAAQILERVGLSGKEHTPSRRLSYGERRALEIGVALAAKPRLLFLDEPTAGLGVEGTARLLELVQSLKRKLSIVIIEHDMNFLFRLADKVSVIHWGQVIAEGTPEALRGNPWVQRSSLGQP